MAFWGFPQYVPKAEKQARAARKLDQLKKKRDVRPVVLQGSAIARTWWGKAWNKNLERYADYTNRIGRGRSYVRYGAVLDLQIMEGGIKSLVQGSRAKPYEIIIKIKKLNRNIWQQITSSCSGTLESLQELLSGDFPKELGEVFMQEGSGLFPSPKEISFECSCPDWASMCKHVAATLYGVGARLDEEPMLFFALRGVDTGDLVAKTVSKSAESMLEKASKRSTRIIADADLSEVFGIDLAGSSDPAAEDAAQAPVRKAGRKKQVKSPIQTAEKKVKNVKKKSAGKTASRKKRATIKSKTASRTTGRTKISSPLR